MPAQIDNSAISVSFVFIQKQFMLMMRHVYRSKYASNCDNEYAEYLSKFSLFVPEKSKKHTLDMLYQKYTTIIKPWVVKQMQRKRSKIPQSGKKTLGTTATIQSDAARLQMLTAVAHLIKGLMVLFKYKNTCLQRELGDILCKAKPWVFRALKHLHGSSLLSFFRFQYPILSVVHGSNVSKNIVQGTCTMSDADVLKFANDVAAVLIGPTHAARLSSVLTKNIFISKKIGVPS